MRFPIVPEAGLTDGSGRPFWLLSPTEELPVIDLGTWQQALVKAIQDYQPPEPKSPLPANDIALTNDDTVSLGPS